MERRLAVDPELLRVPSPTGSLVRPPARVEVPCPGRRLRNPLGLFRAQFAPRPHHLQALCTSSYPGNLDLHPFFNN